MTRFLGMSHLLAPILSTSLSLLLAGCEQDASKKEVPTEPWRRDDAPDPKKGTAARQRYVVAADSTLSFSLPTKRTKPQGTLHAISGHLVLDPAQLQFVSGEIHVDFSQVQMDESVRPPEQSGPESSWTISPRLAQDLAASSWTTQARNWLGLGKDVAQSKRFPTAKFVIESARDLSHPRADAGAMRRPSEGSSYKSVRVVDGTVVGTLSLNHLSVARTVGVRLLFFYDEGTVSRETQPNAIEVHLRGNLGVLLSEYEIGPRDAAGHELSELSAVLGHWVGDTALVSGQLTFQKSAL